MVLTRSTLGTVLCIQGYPLGLRRCTREPGPSKSGQRESAMEESKRQQIKEIVLHRKDEPSHFNARAMARWLASRGRPHAKRQQTGPRPTLGDLQRSHCWTWVYCEKCWHHAPMALVPLIIRWGADTSSDRLRQSARCIMCGHKGATLQHPGWAGTHIGFQPFPLYPHHAL